MAEEKKNIGVNASKSEQLEMFNYMKDLFINGKSKATASKMLAKRFNVTQRTGRDYYKRVEESIKNTYTIDKEFETKKVSIQLDNLYSKLMEAGNYKEAANVLMKKINLHGLAEHKRVVNELNINHTKQIDLSGFNPDELKGFLDRINLGNTEQKVLNIDNYQKQENNLMNDSNEN